MAKAKVVANTKKQQQQMEENEKNGLGFPPPVAFVIHINGECERECVHVNRQVLGNYGANALGALVIGDDLMRPLHHTNRRLKRGDSHSQLQNKSTKQTHMIHVICVWIFPFQNETKKMRKPSVLTLYSCSRLFHFLMIFDSGNGT